MQEKQNLEARTVLAPDCPHRVVLKIILGFLQMLRISWGVNVCAVSIPVLGKCMPQSALFLLCSKGKAAGWGKYHQGWCQCTSGQVV